MDVLNAVKGLAAAVAFPLLLTGVAYLILTYGQSVDQYINQGFYFLCDGWGPIAKTVFTIVGCIIVLQLLPKKETAS